MAQVLPTEVSRVNGFAAVTVRLMVKRLSDSLPPRSLRQVIQGTWGDRFLLLLILIGIGVSWLHVHALAGSGEAMVTIYHGQTQLAQYPLHTPKPIHFTARGELGDSEIMIAHNSVFFLKSPCRNKLCILAGHKHRIGDMIACVPNRILVAISGTARRFDAVVE